MRLFHIESSQVTESPALADWALGGLPPRGYVWIACTREELEGQHTEIQGALQSWCGNMLVDLHVSDLLNPQLPSRYDYTAEYDVLVFRRLAAGSSNTTAQSAGVSCAPDNPLAPLRRSQTRGGPPILRRIDTSPVGFAVFDRVLLSVHPADCGVRDAYAAKLMLATATEVRATGARLPSSPADLMLRVINQMVDGYLALRRELTHQLDHWQSELLNPKTRFNNWASLLDARLTLHQLDEVCEEQRSCIQDWIEAVKTWPEAATAQESRERELLQVRSRDVLEHIERVVHHVRRLEQSAETAVQMHFNAQSNRTNDIMRTLTALTAIFLPLNLIAGIFGMNFEFIPLLHLQSGFWWAMGSMTTIAGALLLVFWRKRYLARSAR
jgi:Mg2+ and Co2+ transporter CorA